MLSGFFLGSELLFCSKSICLLSLVVIDAGIHQLIQQVAYERRRYHERCEEDRGRHYHGVIPVGYGAYELAAYAAYGEYGLDYHGAGDYVGDLRARIGYHGNEGVPQGVLEYNGPLVYALCLCGADIVLTQRVQHAGLGKTGICGTVFGSIAALMRNKWPDRVIVFLSTLFTAVPSFVLATLLLLVFCIKLGWVPVWSPNNPSYVLPVIALSAYPMAYITRLSKTP